jgi:alpha-1,6-mannosyltransferase
MSGGLETAVRSVVAFKLLAVLCAIVAVAGVTVAAARLRAGAGAIAAVAFGWNPLVVIHLAGDGHNDAAMLLFLAWGIVALTARRPAVTFVLFAAATLIKPAAGLALLMLAVSLMRGRDFRTLVVGAGTSVLLAVVLYLPLWDGTHVLRPTLEEGGYFTNTPASLARHGVAWLIGGQASEHVVGVAVRAALFVVALLLAWRSRDRSTDLLLRIGIAYALAVVLLGTWYQPWYATWPLLFLSVALVSRPSWIWLMLGLTAGGLLVPVATNFAAAMAGRRAEDVVVDAFAVALVLAPLGAAWLVMQRRAAHGPKIRRPVLSPPVKSI